jgi:hypothetical protein
VVTLPLTDLSAPTVKLPDPEADVLTGGTSLDPLSITLTAPPDIIEAQPASTTAAVPTPAQNSRLIPC